MVCRGKVGTIAEVINAELSYIPPALTFQGVTTDSRQVQAGQLFVALRGEKFDGHQFIPAALAKGAVVAVADRSAVPNLPNHLPLLVVENTLTAYQQIAHWWRQQLSIPIVAITGSAGKTTTKELISALLRCFLEVGKQVHKTIANENNEIGVPKTILGVDPAVHQFAVIEMAMRGRGQIAELTRIAQPHIGVITNIGTAHIGILGSQQAIAEAKCELLAEMPTTSIAVLNGNDNLLLATARRVWHGTTIYYGLNTGDINGLLENDRLRVIDQNHTYTWKLPLLGEHNALNFLAGLGVLKALNLDFSKTQTQLILDLPTGRATTIDLGNDIILFDETYNASPDATIASLKLLANAGGKRTWAVLSTNLELGDFSAELHQQIGRAVHDLGIDFLVILSDPEAEQIAAGLPENSPVTVYKYPSHEDIVTLLTQELQPHDRVLCKASHAIHMDRVITGLVHRYREMV